MMSEVPEKRAPDEPRSAPVVSVPMVTASEALGDGWNADRDKYHLCCCHVKTFTLVWGAIEMLVIVAVLLTSVGHLSRNGMSRHRHHHRYHYERDLDRRLAARMEPWEDELKEEVYDRIDELADKKNASLDELKEDVGEIIERANEKHKVYYRDVYYLHYAYYRRRSNRANREAIVAGMIWTSMLAVVVVLMLHGVRKGKWGYMVPHLTLHGFWLCVNAAVLMLLVALTATHGRRVCRVLGASVLWTGVNAYVFAAILRCAFFLRDQAKAAKARGDGGGGGASVAPIYLVTPDAVPHLPPGAVTVDLTTPPWAAMGDAPPEYQRADTDAKQN